METSTTCSNRNDDFSITTVNNEKENESDMLLRVSKIIPAQPAHWVGDGFHVYPVFGRYAFRETMSPFLMFDYAAPKKFPADPSRVRKPRGVGQHPHRGFETVTIAFQGEVEHADSVGNRDVIGSGDVQWMTAGRGIIHEEYHSRTFTKNGGTFEMCQLWVNLPKKHKMTKPRYQPILSKDIPTVTFDEATTEDISAASEEKKDATNATTASVRVIAGSLNGVEGPAKTFSPVELWDVTMPRAGAVVNLPYPERSNCVVFVRRGGVNVFVDDGNDATRTESIGPQAVAILEPGGNTLRLSAHENDTSLLVMGGEPINEPIAARGPFVMNTVEELQQAMVDYSSGKMGR